jgi:chromosome segregation ATPase
VIEGNRVTWTINGRPAVIDSLAERWQKAVIDLLDARYEADALREQEASLRMEADSLPARREATRQRIAQIERRQVQLNNQILAERNRETQRRNELSLLERQRDDIQRRLSAEERKTATNDDRARAAAEANIRRLSNELSSINDRIRRYDSYASQDVDRRIAAIEAQLRELQSGHNLALLRLQLSNYDSTDVEDLRQQITQLGAPQRLPALEARVEKARLALLAILEGRGKAPSR